MAAKPISPSAVVAHKTETLPDAVIEAFNELIAENASGGHASFGQDDVVKRMVAKGLEREEIFRRGWLDVEDVYKRAGWKVEYDRPGWNETYEPRFTFTQRRCR